MSDYTSYQPYFCESCKSQLGHIRSDTGVRLCNECSLPHPVSQNTLIAKINPNKIDTKTANARKHNKLEATETYTCRIDAYCIECKEETITSIMFDSDMNCRRTCLKCGGVSR